MIQLTSPAVKEVLRLKARHKNANLLRLDVCERGCLGLSYLMQFEEGAQEGDQIYDCNTVQVVVSAKRLPHLDGLLVDYTEDLMGGGFRFQNPNSTQSCSCGISFSAAHGSD